MKITKLIECSQEVEVHVCADDIRVILEESDNPVHCATVAINDIAGVLKAVTDDMISKMSRDHCKLIAGFLAEQAERFKKAL